MRYSTSSPCVHFPTFQNPHLQGQWSTLEFKCKIAKELCSATFTSYLPQQNIQNKMVLLTELRFKDGKVSSTRRITILGIIVKPCSISNTLEIRASDIKSNMWRFMISVNTLITVRWTLQHLHLLPPNKNYQLTLFTLLKIMNVMWCVFF